LTRNFLCIMAAIICVAAIQTQAQTSLGLDSDSASVELWNKSILSINVEGIFSADTFLVINSSGLFPGDLLTPGKVQDAIKGVYALGLFSDVQIIGFPQSNGVQLTIEVSEYPKLHSLKISGNKSIKTKKIKESLTIFEGRLISPEAIKNNIEKIKSLYSDKGYLLAAVDVKKTPSEANQVDMQFDIVEGQKVKVESIAFLGNQHLTSSQIRRKMSTKQKSFFRSGNFNRDKYLDDKDKVVEYFKDNGYIDAVITGDSIWYSPDKTHMYIKIGLKEGDKYYFGNLTWQGNSIINNSQFQQNLKFKLGQVYNQKKYDETLNKYHEMYQNEGYWYAQIDEKTNPRGDTLDFHLTVTENNPVHIRLVNIDGNNKTREKVIRRELTIMPETVFKRDVLGRSLRDLMILNFFSNVEPGWDVLPNGDIDLKIKVTEKETGQFSIGAGYSQLDKFVGTIGLGIPNIFGTGKTASLNLELGKNLNTYDFSYLDPWFRDTPTSISIDLYRQSRQWYSWFQEQRLGGDVSVGRRLRWPDNYTHIYGGYRLESLKYTNIDSTYAQANRNDPNAVSQPYFHWPLETSSASVTLMRDSRDLSQFATKGSILSWKAELAGTPLLGGDWNYYKNTFTAEYYHKLFWRVVAMGRTKYGAMSSIKHGRYGIPYGERFSPGGVDPDGTIRGYDDGLVGPTEISYVNGAPYTAYLRGRFEVIYNLELTIAISEQQFYILLFADAGNAYLNSNDIHLTKGYVRSVGPGFRIVIPLVGIMGFDFGYPFDGPDKHHIKTHFQIGKGF
jgi:outer membrane protein insertion porin family